MDDLDNLGDCLKTMSVRSKSSARRMAFRVNRPSAHSFYSTAPAAINYTAGVDDEDDEDDSTYEASTETESNSVPSDHSSQEMPVAEQREEMEFCDTFPSSINSTIANDDASDYLGSDDGLGPNDEEVQRDARGYQKYFERASSLIQNPNYPCYFGLPADTVYWVVKLSRFNSDERRWVNKGPVILYFNFNEHPRLMANYLYSTKSTCLDLQCNNYLCSI